MSQGGAVLRRSAMRCLQFSCSQTLGLLACAHCSLGVFSSFSRSRTASPEHFRLSRACALLPRLVFGLCAFAHGFPGVFLGFSRLRIAFPARFWASRVCARLPLRVFELLACAHGFPGVFSSFSRLRIASPGVFVARRSLAYEFSYGKLAGFSRLRICRKAKPCLRVFLRKTRGTFSAFSRSRTASCRKAELCFVAARCAVYGFPARKLSGFARGRAGKSTFNLVRTKINIQ